MAEGITELFNFCALVLVESFVVFLISVERVGVLASINPTNTSVVAIWGVALDRAAPLLKLHKPNIIVRVVVAEFLIVAEEFHEAGTSHEEHIGVRSLELT